MKSVLNITLVLLLLTALAGFTFLDKDKKKKKEEGVEAPYKLKLRDIVIRFQTDVYEVEKCRILMKEASGLSREVKTFMRTTSTLVQEEKDVLLKLSKDASAVKYAIEALRDTGWTITPISKFERGCDILGADMEFINKDQYCVFIIKVTVNEYVAHLLENPDLHGNMIRYSWKKAYEIGGGIVNMALYESTVMRIFDNETKPERYPAEVFNILCTPFPE